MSFELLKTLCETAGAPGYEQEFAALIYRELQPIADEMFTDTMGNVYAVKRGSSPSPRTIMIAAHMDEIAFLVRGIDPNGFVSIYPLGGFTAAHLVAQRVLIHGTEKIGGVFGTKAAMAEYSPGKVTDMFIDTGLDAATVKEKIRIGDVVTMVGPLQEMGNFYTGKTLDDRVGIYAMIEAFKRMTHNTDTIVAVATVQEEVGMRGAKGAAFRIEPDMGIALDITVAGDAPGSDSAMFGVKMGEGVAIKLVDQAAISHRGLVNFFRNLAEKHSIKHQWELLPAGGTDAGAMQIVKRGGIPVITLSIPNRYTHTVVESCHKQDIEATIALLTHFMESSHELIP